jgi:hypothetical protein
MTNEMNDLLPLIARFDAFANEFMTDRETMIELIDECDDRKSSIEFMIDDRAIANLIDSQFDDDFAIITDDDENTNSIYIEFIECNRFAFTIYMIMRIRALIA